MDCRILIANGVNLDLLGKREPDIYGAFTLPQVEKTIENSTKGLAKLVGFDAIQLSFFQSNQEGEFFAKISQNWDGILINPGAWSHTSLALADRLKAVNIPYVEVHLSNISAREPIRHKSLCASSAAGVVYGLGLDSYLTGLYALLLKVYSSKSGLQP
ncbi:MAG: type II 3-dehydroquinate dehydratase [Bdellovibrionota bacterium]